MKTIRGKFQLQSVKEYAGYYGTAQGPKELRFGAVYDSSIPEDQKYAEATPSGSVEMQVKPDVADQFKLGEFYYVDFTPVAAAAADEATA